VLDLLLAPVAVAVPAGHEIEVEPAGHDWQQHEADLDGYLQTTLPSRSMGREDPLFFASALAAGTALARMSDHCKRDA